MENSFFEYRAESDDNSEIIDNSYLDESFIPNKTPAKKNQTVYIPESDDDSSAENSCEESLQISKTVNHLSSLNQPLAISSSDDDLIKRGSIRKHAEWTSKNVVSSSEDEAEVSPEMVPRRRPQTKAKRSSDSFIGRQKKKRMFLIESDTDNSIIMEHNKNRKVKCLKETPDKISTTKNVSDVQNISIQDDESDKENSDEARCNSSKDSRNSINEMNFENTEEPSDNIDDNTENENETNCKEDVDSEKNKDSRNNVRYTATKGSKEIIDSSNVSSNIDHSDNRSSNDKQVEETDEEQDEDIMVMSRATRMSIMGVIPKDNDSDESDFIQSEDSGHTSRTVSETSLPEVTLKSPEKVLDDDTSRISCSPFSSPHRDITNTEQASDNSICDLTHLDSDVLPSNGVNRKNKVNKHKDIQWSNKPPDDVCDLTQFDDDDMKTKVKSRLSKVSGANNVSKEVIDDDITIIEQKPEIIALLSSDDEDEVTNMEKSQNKEKLPNKKKSPNFEKSTKPNISPESSEPVTRLDSTIRQYLIPASYPNQVVYVKKEVRENELNKLNRLKEDLQNIRYLLSNMDVDTLPDGGVKLIERLTDLEREVRKQGDKVAKMIVEPDIVTEDVINNDGFNKEHKGLSWDDIQKASNAVQPRMFGKQAMSTHMAERNLILERLRNLHESMASRPPENELATPPPLLKSTLMQHQLHALAWLRWRETQSPPGGVLADDMGLGKTITMISLIASDKEKIPDDDEDDASGSKRMVRGGTLVVCPASLVQQWAGEVSTHCVPHALSVCLHHGAARATQPHRLAPHDIVISTYNILQRETEKNSALTRVLWRRVILDEAHVVRNHKSATSGAVCGLRARRRWALTGTPLHNKDLDLFALLKFLHTTPFDDLAMWKKWIDNKSIGGQERLNTIMQCLMLRRTKAQLQERGQLACLPERQAHEEDVVLQTDEMNVYQKVLLFSKTLFAQFLHQRAERQADGFDGAHKSSAYDKMHKKMIAMQGAKPVKSHEILVLLLRLRQVCCHCGLIAAMLDDTDAAPEDDGSKDLLADLNKLSLEDGNKRKSGRDADEQDEQEEEGESTSVAEALRSVLSPNNPVFNLQRQSSKIRSVLDCLNKNVFSQRGEKAVVVSQWTSVLDLVEHELKRAGVRCVTLSGAVAVGKRNALVTALNDPASDVRVMLLSLCAGGVGLNLCGANHLLLLDPHWNPQLEQQAQDRVYRVGQLRPVHIYRFMCLDTVEQSIRQLQKAKLEMAENVLTGARNHASKLTIEDLRVLFNMGSQTGT